MTTIITIVVMLFFILSCSNDKQESIGAIVDRSAMPRLHAMDITTVISDSGVTRYRISAPQWDIYDRSSQPYWEFPSGVHFERFDLNLNVDANIHCKYAKFLENEQLWELKGDVRATNLKGELFETERLFWSQKEERIYSDTLIKITQTNKIIKGTGFESNQQMTKYLIVKTSAIIPVEEDNTSPN